MTGFSALAATSTSDAVDAHVAPCAHRLQRPVYLPVEARDDRMKASQQLLAARAKVLELRGELPGALLTDGRSPD